MWKRLSKWSYEELEQGLLRQPAREQRLLDEIKRRRKKEIEKNIWEAEKLEQSKTSAQRREKFFYLARHRGADLLFPGWHRRI